MTIREILKYKVWADFFNKNSSPSFLQSWEWGSFQKALGYRVLRLGIYNRGKLSAICLVIKIKSKKGSFLFIPHGPVMESQIQISNFKSQISNLKSYLTQIAKKEKFSFIRIAPILKNTPQNNQFFKDLNFKTAPIYMHAESVWTLPFFDESIHRNLSEEELLVKMRKTTRYSIRKAVRDGVVIEKRTDKKAIDDFYKIYQETAKRENFIPFSKDYIKKEFEEFNKTGNAVFLFAKVHKIEVKAPVLSKSLGLFSNLLASALIIFTKSTAFYHQGASFHTKIPAPYLLQWQAICEAKKRGCTNYNFWGIYDEESKRMPKAWQGLTLFKTGFGGKKISYIPTQDYIVSPKYFLTFLFETLLSWRREV